MLTKKATGYYYDHEAEREPAKYRRQQTAQRRREGAPPFDRQDKAITNCWIMAPESHVPDHIATFPVMLSERCIRLGCPPGGIVLDPFAGSGTTGVAAKLHGRSSIMIDLNAAYCKLAEQRIAETRAPDDDQNLDEARLINNCPSRALILIRGEPHTMVALAWVRRHLQDPPDAVSALG
jgi:DNA modification methylase